MKKFTLITGATGGLGKAFADEFGKHNQNLLLIGRNIDKLNSLKDELLKKYKIEILVYNCDLKDYDTPEKIKSFVDENNIFINVLINNAGFAEFGEFSKTDINKHLEMVDVNVRSVVYLTHIFMQDMIKNKEGKIMNLASIAAFCSGPYMSTYYASKSYVLLFSEALAKELKNTGVTVTALCPGTTATGFEKAANLDNSKLFKTLRVVTPDKVATFAFKKLYKNKEIAIFGITNRILIFLLRLVPRKFARWVICKIQAKRG